MSRDALIREFLIQHGFATARSVPLAQDASFRRYLRLTGGPRPAVLMDAPPPEDVRPFVRIAAHLAACGISTPEIIAADTEAGFLLEEDLGDALFSSWPDQVETLFDAAVDALIAMQRAAPPPDLPRWDAATMASTALAVLFDWWWPAAFGAKPPDAAKQDIATALDQLLLPVARGPTCFVHRDFFVENLIWLPDREGIRRVGVIDVQGAALGHPAYDLVSLLQDARREIPTEIADRAISRYLTLRPEFDAEEFRTAYAACAAQRHLRVAAQWVRLAQRDGRPRYLAYGPHTWGLLEKAVREPIAAPLRAALDRWIPPAMRGNPPGLAA